MSLRKGIRGLKKKEVKIFNELVRPKGGATGTKYRESFGVYNYLVANNRGGTVVLEEFFLDHTLWGKNTPPFYYGETTLPETPVRVSEFPPTPVWWKYNQLF